VARPLESVPNFSEGRDRATIDALAEALGSRARLRDVHADEDHNRSVFTLVGSEEELTAALLAGIRARVTASICGAKTARTPDRRRRRGSARPARRRTWRGPRAALRLAER
jgi:glutamate formiminotransferase